MVAGARPQEAERGTWLDSQWPWRQGEVKETAEVGAKGPPGGMSWTRGWAKRAPALGGQLHGPLGIGGDERLHPALAPGTLPLQAGLWGGGQGGKGRDGTTLGAWNGGGSLGSRETVSQQRTWISPQAQCRVSPEVRGQERPLPSQAPNSVL